MFEFFGSYPAVSWRPALLEEPQIKDSLLWISYQVQYFKVCGTSLGVGHRRILIGYKTKDTGTQ